ncbi:adenylate cyclase, terminal-differentiation specific isoform X2 [Rhodamnia argentea]|uniref:Adenylate cyclase, terminal-differentiation specific isoform X2 n=1 Tax=Rhodamnia argentea TaxID=178133 RepID=A0A8B8PKW9_9MYRT|nr:adenylate cyclase, terminal-differentiation specific isoform X2 [Rhodamnia argentea]
MATHEQEQEREDQEHPPEQEPGGNRKENENENWSLSLATYLGLSFSLFLAHLPRNALTLLPNLQTQVKGLSFALLQAEDQLRQMRSRRKEDSKANARVVEIFASHRNGWQEEERRLMQQLDEANEEMAHLRARMEETERVEAEYKARVEELEREVGERDEMIGFMSRRVEFGEESDRNGGHGDVEEASEYDYGQQQQHHHHHHHQYQYLNRQQEEQTGNVFGSEYLGSASRFWAEKASVWQDAQYESLESLPHSKHYVTRESPWKLNGEGVGVSSKLKLLEQELLNLEKVGDGDPSKVPLLMRKQAKRYQALAGKIDDLCRKMQASDPCEPTLSSEFRTQRQTEFLLEAFRLQQRAAETGQKLMALHAEVGKSYYVEELGGHAKLTTRRSMDSIRNNFKEIQRNLEIWLARIIGDLKGILARDGASRVREYYVARYPFVQ